MPLSRRAGLPHVLSLLLSVACCLSNVTGSEPPFFRSEFLQPPDSLHNHGSCVVETAHGDLLACWFRGSGERQADDVKIVGARLRRGAAAWSEAFIMADTPDLPDTNCCMVIDPRGILWLIWPTILDNQWESALLKSKTSDDFLRDGPPVWKTSDVIHVKPGPEFAATVKIAMEHFRPRATEPKIKEYIDYALAASTDKLKLRLGWMTRAHPFILDGRRLIVPLYSDGFNFSLMAITDDWGQTWHTSSPLIGEGNVQPSIVRRQDGSLYAMMRDNGLLPSGSNTRPPAMAASRGPPSPTPPSLIPAPDSKSLPSPTATGSSSTTTPKTAVTVSAFASPTTKARRGNGPAT